MLLKDVSHRLARPELKYLILNKNLVHYQRNLMSFNRNKNNLNKILQHRNYYRELK